MQEQKDITAELHACKPLRVTKRVNKGGGRHRLSELLCGDEVDYHADDAGAAGAAAQVHARAPDFVLQKLVQLPAQLLHQLSHLGNKLICILSIAIYSNVQTKKTF